MTVHLIKLSVGPESISDLVAWQEERLQQRRSKGEPQELIHITRHKPKREAELLDGGSIYWVIKGWLCARQELLAFRPVTHNGIEQCAIVYAPELIRVHPRKHRPFQGWRYLPTNDVPPDLPRGTRIEDIDSGLGRTLAELGLL